ncbi:MAG TPA: transglycosylase domain-containing protein [Terricaulis sp.]|nr:transglycosylase domain-containing protein [Terricaulis sp.]
MSADEPENADGAPKAPPPVPPPPELFARDTFGEPDIPMPPSPRPGDRQRMRDARHNIDLDLNRIKRRKRYGLFLTTLTVLFVAFVLLPVTWVGAYLFIDPPSNVLMMQRAAEGQTISRYPVAINRVSPHVIRAVIAAEDAKFCAHDGFDVEAIQDAMESNAQGRARRGASTISQQVAKNLFLWPDSSWLRKGFEVYFTALIEFMYPKRRIMEHYLNIAEWGDGNFGIEAAARALWRLGRRSFAAGARIIRGLTCAGAPPPSSSARAWCKTKAPPPACCRPIAHDSLRKRRASHFWRVGCTSCRYRL